MGEVMSDGRIKQITYLSLFAINALIWYSIFTNGFFITATWVVVLSAIIGIIFRLKGEI